MTRPKKTFVLDEQPGAPKLIVQVKAYLISQKLNAVDALESLDMDTSGDIQTSEFVQVKHQE